MVTERIAQHLLIVPSKSPATKMPPSKKRQDGALLHPRLTAEERGFWFQTDWPGVRGGKDPPPVRIKKGPGEKVRTCIKSRKQKR